MTPSLFIASSKEGMPIANALQANVQEFAEPTVWYQGLFDLSTYTLPELIKNLDYSDFAAFVFSPDDAVSMRGENKKTVRDNVILELGLFLGRLGLDRCFVLAPDIEELHIPTDLLGLTIGRFKIREDCNWRAALGGLSDQIRMQMEKCGPRCQKEVGQFESNLMILDADHEDLEDRLGRYIEQRNARVAREANRRDLISRLLHGETVEAVEIEGHTYRIGDHFPVPGHRWITVMNLDGIANENGRHEFGGSCSISEAGYIEIVAFDRTENGQWRALCRFNSSESRAGAQCGNGTLFFRYL